MNRHQHRGSVVIRLVPPVTGPARLPHRLTPEEAREVDEAIVSLTERLAEMKRSGGAARRGDDRRDR